MVGTGGLNNPCPGADNVPQATGCQGTSITPMRGHHSQKTRRVTYEDQFEFPTQLTSSVGGAKDCLDHKFHTPPSLQCPIANSASTKSQPPVWDG